MFTPKAGLAPGEGTPMLFTLKVSSSAGTATTNGSIVVNDVIAAVAPTITGTKAGWTSTSEAVVKPFAGVGIVDPNANAKDTVTIQVVGGGNLSGAGLSSGANGTYTLAAVTAAAVTAEIDGLSYKAKAGAAGTTQTGSFVITDTSSAGTSVRDSTVTVLNSDPSNSANKPKGGQVGEEVYHATKYDGALTGTGGHDTFVFKPNEGDQTVYRFKVAGADHDTLRLVGSPFHGIAQMLHDTTMLGGNATVFVSPDETVTLAGVNKAEMWKHAHDFQFHA